MARAMAFCEILQNTDPVHLDEFAESHAGDGGESSIPFLVEKLLGVLVCK